MPHETTWESHGVYTRFYGSVPFSELLAFFQSIAADPRFDDISYYIDDYTGVATHDVKFEDVELLAGLDYAQTISNPRLLRATVGVRDDMRALFARYRESHDRRDHLAVFSTVEEARAWIAARSETGSARRAGSDAMERLPPVAS